MFKMSFSILQKDLQINKKDISEGSVAYDFLPGNIKLQTDSGIIDMSWGWITVLDFAIFFKRICNSLSRKIIGIEEFGFTENDEYLELSRENDTVKIRPSFEGDTLMVDFEEFCKEVYRFYDSVLEEVFAANPFLRCNKKFLRIVNNVD